jgi:hypothetical protein
MLGDGWHASSQTPEQMRDYLERLRKVADEAGRAFKSLELSLRLPLRADAVQGSRQAIIDQYGAYKALGLNHLVVDFRRDDLSQMLEVLDMVARDIRPAVQN